MKRFLPIVFLPACMTPATERIELLESDFAVFKGAMFGGLDRLGEALEQHGISRELVETLKQALITMQGQVSETVSAMRATQEAMIPEVLPTSWPEVVVYGLGLLGIGYGGKRGVGALVGTMRRKKNRKSVRRRLELDEREDDSDDY